jgi:hypothetical protein
MLIATETLKIIESFKIPNKLIGGMMIFKLWPKQVELLELLHTEKRLVVVKKRQVGLSLLTGADSLIQCMGIENYHCLVLSKTEQDAIEYLKRIKNIYLTLDKDIKKIFKIKKDNYKSIEFENGSRIQSLPANRGAGMTADRVIIDEAAYITPRDSHISLDETMSRVEPTLDKSEGQLIIISTANGYNLFQQYYAKAKQGGTSWKHFFFSCWDDPTFTKEKRADIIRSYGEQHCKQEYPENDNECFLMSGNCRFNTTILSSMQGSLKNGKKVILERVGRKIVATENPNGWVEIFEYPKINEVYIGGFDTSEGLEIKDLEASHTTDLSAGVILDKNLKQVAQIHCRFEPDVFAEEIERICLYYNDAFCAVERNKDGLGVINILKNQKNYTNLYYQEGFNPETHLRDKKIGWSTDRTSKPLLVSYFDQLIREKKVQIFSDKLLHELTTFVRFADGTTGAQDNCHDDLAMSIMIACFAHQYAPLTVPYEKRFFKDGKFYDGYENIVKETVNDQTRGGYG